VGGAVGGGGGHRHGPIAALYLIPIGERADAMRRHFEERLISAQDALRDLDAVVRHLHIV
jgi:hypothetical protein